MPNSLLSLNIGGKIVQGRAQDTMQLASMLQVYLREYHDISDKDSYDIINGQKRLEEFGVKNIPVLTVENYNMSNFFSGKIK